MARVDRPRADDNVVGLAFSEDGRVLRDLVAADPPGWRGTGPWPGIRDHDAGLLLKLLDAGQRLPVTSTPAEPSRPPTWPAPTASRRRGTSSTSTRGRPSTSAWTEDVDPDALVRRIAAQDGDWMLARMHRVRSGPETASWCPRGLVHAIGAGVFVAEVQEPTDFSILLEWSAMTAAPRGLPPGAGRRAGPLRGQPPPSRAGRTHAPHPDG